LAPDFKTIADFRKDNGKAIRNVCREFIMLCRRLNLFSEAMLLSTEQVQGREQSDKNFTPHKLKARVQQLEEKHRALPSRSRPRRSRSDIAHRRPGIPLQDKIAAVRSMFASSEDRTANAAEPRIGKSR
jgi:hypothetical protein